MFTSETGICVSINFFQMAEGEISKIFLQLWSCVRKEVYFENSIQQWSLKPLSLSDDVAQKREHFSPITWSLKVLVQTVMGTIISADFFFQIKAFDQMSRVDVL